MKKKRMDLALHVKLIDYQGRDINLIEGGFDQFQSETYFILTLEKFRHLHGRIEKGFIRIKRHSPKLKNRENQDDCRLHPYSVNVDRLGYGERIFLPKVFEFNYCKGRCDHRNLNGENIDNHALMTSLYKNIKGRSKRNPKLCCVPTKTEPLSLLFTDHFGNIIFDQIDNMVATECGCRA
ncbi:DgyrCDS8005 [Dimorphilus gyrociliatus]|uniref:DgyrCDS8005 n=1 Tax=Dimorphilus gyrociliatus TaxID=2664684 RepID=A0A7I8VSV6_9ANNE|nr:DgyrCDS8005 [Dimorphilus gyrociliatus]